MVVKLTPTWESKTKPARDADGWKRGAIGCDGLYDADGRDFMKSHDPAADKKAYGTVRPNGAQKVTSGAHYPSNLRDKFKGASGIDAGLEGDDA